MTTASAFSFHHEKEVRLNTSPEKAFVYLDDFRQLSAHMTNSSAMMAGSKMTLSTDEQDGRAPGARVRMEGKVLGLTLALEEVVTEREPPFTKVWQTVRSDLLVIGEYQLGFALGASGGRSLLRVFIDYDLPQHGFARWLGKLLGRTYARWCVERMANDAAARFPFAAAGAS
ncbi:MAG: SRPBCC family protein [Burkholderiaceae bacterium]|nr:SRPBCC family protein [Burkholderiaceae bacterium]